MDSSPEYCRQACERSLQRLGVPHIDLYYAHRLDGKTPVEKTVEELKKLKQEGKIKYLGLSECSSESLRRACKVEHIDAVYNHHATPVRYRHYADIVFSAKSSTPHSRSTSKANRSAS